MPERIAVRHLLWALVPLAAVGAAYALDLGQGFIKDDFAWILQSRFEGPWGWLDLFGRHNGFYRPIVSLSFAANEHLFGLDPLPYALTNLALVFLAMAGIVLLARALGMGWGTALLAASLWGLNWRVISWGVLWISGRTSLLVTIFSLLAAAASVRGRVVLASLACLLALLSKEEAVLLPFILATWAGLSPNSRFDGRRALRHSAALLVPLTAYLALRHRTTAYLPWSAPSFYSPTGSATHLLMNVGEYADRACSLCAGAVVLAALLLWRRPRVDSREGHWFRLGVIWLIGGYGLTVFLPIRSNLYALLPSVGSALAAAALLHAAWRVAEERRRRWVLVAGAILPFALVPVAHARNARMARPAAFSAQAVATLRSARNEIAARGAVVLQDVPSGRASIREAFGDLATDAVRLATGLPAVEVRVDLPRTQWRAAGIEDAVELHVRDGRLVRE